MFAFSLQAVPRLYGCKADAANFVMSQGERETRDPVRDVAAANTARALLLVVIIFQSGSDIMQYGSNPVMGAFESEFECLTWSYSIVGDLGGYPCEEGADIQNIAAFNTALAAWKAANADNSPSSAIKLSLVVDTVSFLIGGLVLF